MALFSIPPGCGCGGTIALVEDRLRDEYRVIHTDADRAGVTIERRIPAHQLARISHLDIPAVVLDIARDLCRESALPPCTCGGTFALFDDAPRAQYVVTHTDRQGLVVERRIDYQAFAQTGNRLLAAGLAGLCPGPRATGGFVAPGMFPLVGAPSPEMYTLPGDPTPRYNRQALEARAREHAPRLVFSDCPCGGLVHWERDEPAARSTFVHLDTRAAIRSGQVTDQMLARTRPAIDPLGCPVAFLDALLPSLAPLPGPAFRCAIEYPDGARATTVVAAADRPAVEAALAAAGVRFTLTPEGA